MSLFGGRRHQRVSGVDGPQVPSRNGPRTGSAMVTPDSALRHSAVWACCALGADLISSMPVDVFRDEDGRQVELAKSSIITEPGGAEWDYLHWMRASQFDLERAANTIGLITERNAFNLPSRIELQAISKCTVIRKGGTGVLQYRIDGKVYDRDQVWHERANVVAGLDVGLDPIAYAAWSVGEYLSIQQFALDWFGGSGVPKARLKNKERILKPKEAGLIKDRWRASIADGDLFVHGNDWEYDFMQAQNSGMEWIEGRRYGLTEICRFYKYPADLIEAAISAPGSITYQSALQRNLQFLILQLGPRIKVRENNLSKLLPRPRYVKINTDALLRMDPETRGRVMDAAIKSRRMTVTEARKLENKPPLTAQDIEEFNTLFGAPRSQVLPAEAPAVTAGADRDLDEREPIHALASVGQPIDWAQPR